MTSCCAAGSEAARRLVSERVDFAIAVDAQRGPGGEIDERRRFGIAVPTGCVA
ncbi:MAG TPA: hypothetical protein VGF39_06540 [Stellaceae bacterium]|jgi:hypothetical protein